MTDILKKYYKIFKMSGHVRFGYGSMYTGIDEKISLSSLLSDCQVSQPGSWFWQISTRELLRPQQSRNDITVQADTLVRGSTPCCMSPGQSCVRELTALPEHLPDREGAWAVKPSRRFESWCSDWLREEHKYNSSPKEYNLQRELRRNYEVLFCLFFRCRLHKKDSL